MSVSQTLNQYVRGNHRVLKVGDLVVTHFAHSVGWLIYSIPQEICDLIQYILVRL